jgi:hypothetical protein
MIDADKKAFKQLIDSMCQSVSHELFTKERLRKWFESLREYDLSELRERIDSYVEANNSIPSIEVLVKNHDVTIRPRVVTPLTVENNKSHMADVQQEIKVMKSKSKDDRAWARKIISGDVKSNWGGAVDFAKKALNMPLDKS